MADGRMLKKKISLNEALANLDNDTHRLLFTWAIPHLDIEGRISGSPRVFKATVAPLLDHLTPEKINKFFKDAHEKGLINRYKISGEWWIEYPKFKENQNLRETREAASRIPPPPENSGTTPGELLEDSVTTPAEVKLKEEKLIEEKLTPLTPLAGGNGFDQDFSLWWKEYPPRRKQDKPGCFKKWRHLKKTGILPDIETMLAILRMQKQSSDWQKQAGEFIPGPGPYLNKHKFLDESILQPQRNEPKGFAALREYIWRRDSHGQEDI